MIEFRWVDGVFLVLIAVLYWLFYRWSKQITSTEEKTKRHEDILRNSEP